MKKWIIGGAIAASVALGGTALADGALDILVNGFLLGKEAKAELKDGTTMVSARSLAEALGADVTWNNDTRTVSIDLPESALLQQQIAQLERALAPSSAKRAVELWAEGVKTRNGALEYAVMDEKLRAQERESFEAIHWVTGTSSPWVDRYKLDEGKTNGDGSMTFRVELVYTDSTKQESVSSLEVTARKQQENGVWLVSGIPGSGTGETDSPAEEFPYDHVTYENQYWAYTLTLPKSWYGKFLAKEEETHTQLLYQSKTGEKSPLITIYSVPTAEWEKDTSLHLHKLGEKKGRVYYYFLPLDNPYEGAEADEYSRMVMEAKAAAATFMLP